MVTIQKESKKEKLMNFNEMKEGVFLSYDLQTHLEKSGYNETQLNHIARKIQRGEIKGIIKNEKLGSYHFADEKEIKDTAGLFTPYGEKDAIGYMKNESERATQIAENVKKSPLLKLLKKEFGEGKSKSEINTLVVFEKVHGADSNAELAVIISKDVAALAQKENEELIKKLTNKEISREQYQAGKAQILAHVLDKSTDAYYFVNTTGSKKGLKDMEQNQIEQYRLSNTDKHAMVKDNIELAENWLKVHENKKRKL